MSAWLRVPRGFRDRVTGVLPEWFWIWLRQLREVELDRRWETGRLLLDAHPSLAAERSGEAALAAHECRAFSQNGQDGIIAFLLDTVSPASKRFVEFGIGDGSENNTANLALTFGWGGLLLEIDPAQVERARRFYADAPSVESGRIRIEQAHVTAENIDGLLRDNDAGEIDLLSLDIDGSDLWIWRAITAIDPRVVVIEYNASFGPARSVSVPYDQTFSRYEAHTSGFYHGASLAALAKVGAEKGYALVGCDSRGTDAFFVKRDAAEGKLRELTPAEAFRPLWERAHLSVEEQFAQIAHLDLVEI